MKTIIISITTLFMLLGCSTKTVTPIVHSAIKPKAECAVPPKFEIRLTVDTYNDEYNSKSLIYSKGFERQRYLYATWSASPVQALQNTIITNLTDCKFKIIYNDMPTAITNIKNLRVVLQNFEQNFNTDGSSFGYLRAQVWLLDTNEQKSKTFEVKVPAKTNDSSGGVIALNTASEIFITELMKWIGEQK